MESGDNDPNRIREASRPEPDAHGQASLLLFESLLHGLLEKRVLTIDEAIDIVTAAGEVKQEIASLGVESAGTAQQSLNLIANIRSSLSFDKRT